MGGAHPILWPAFAQVLLVFAVWAVMFVHRVGHMKRTPPTPEDFATAETAARYFAPVEPASANFRNLFEMPVLFFALAPLLLVTGRDTGPQVGLAWAYVALRAAHSAIHIGRGPVGRRFLAYFASCIVLAAMWVGFAVDVLRPA